MQADEPGNLGAAPRTREMTRSVPEHFEAAIEDIDHDPLVSCPRLSVGNPRGDQGGEPPRHAHFARLLIVSFAPGSSPFVNSTPANSRARIEASWASVGAIRVLSRSALDRVRAHAKSPYC